MVFVKILDKNNIASLKKHNKRVFFRDLDKVKKYLNGYPVKYISFYCHNLIDQLTWLLDLSTDDYIDYDYIEISGIYRMGNLIDLAEKHKDYYDELINKKIAKLDIL